MLEQTFQTKIMAPMAIEAIMPCPRGRQRGVATQAIPTRNLAPMIAPITRAFILSRNSPHATAETATPATRPVSALTRAPGSSGGGKYRPNPRGLPGPGGGKGSVIDASSLTPSPAHPEERRDTHAGAGGARPLDRAESQVARVPRLDDLDAKAEEKVAEYEQAEDFTVYPRPTHAEEQGEAQG